MCIRRYGTAPAGVFIELRFCFLLLNTFLLIHLAINDDLGNVSNLGLRNVAKGSASKTIRNALLSLVNLLKQNENHVYVKMFVSSVHIPIFDLCVKYIKNIAIN